jgi:crotonobetainyl-CoA:carnitine CoA-transferase CaiB-like acyl-CoA transferase
MTDEASRGAATPQSLAGVRVLDLARVLAGPWCTQILADLGADVIKVERPTRDGHPGGDDTRGWGPPFLRDRDGHETRDAAYYLGTNRNKRSITIDLATPEGQALVRRLATQCDVLIENYKVGDMARYGLDAPSLLALHPGLVYCSITGFGQTGPYRGRAGYDYAAQGMGGLMSVTGRARKLPTTLRVQARRRSASLWPTFSPACTRPWPSSRRCATATAPGRARRSTWRCSTRRSRCSRTSVPAT